MKKRLGTLLLALLMLLSIVPGQCFAEEAAVLAPEEEPAEEAVSAHFTVPVDKLPDADKLLEGYLYQLAAGKPQAAPSPVRRAKAINSNTNILVQLLTDAVTKIANGERDSSEVSFTGTVLTDANVKVIFNKADLGLAPTDPFFETKVVDGNTVNVLTETVSEGLKNQGFDSQMILQLLLTNHPFEMYWMDKTKGISTGISASTSGNTLTVTGYNVTFMVSQDYAVGDSSSYDPTQPDTTKTSAAANAVKTAQSVVNNNADKSDYEKLVAYKNYICEAVEYNTAAANTANYPYGDPWQLIYVFDGNLKTNVVCEGYAKAFKYLCDLTWKGTNPAVKCYLATGTMTGGKGAGPHMWNIVTIGGRNYLADVTNSDTGTVGYDGRLFLKGASGSVESGYTVHGVSFVYDPDTKAVYDMELELSATAFDPAAVTYPEYDLNGGGFDISDLQYLFEYLSTGTVSSGMIDTTKADVNKDGQVNILDYQALYEAYKVWVSKAA